MTFNIITIALRVYLRHYIDGIQHNGTRDRVSLCWVSRFIYYFAECRYAQFRYAECRGATSSALFTFGQVQGILKGEVSLYHWPPVWLVWNQLYDNWYFLFLFAKHTNPNQSNRRSTVQLYFPF